MFELKSDEEMMNLGGAGVAGSLSKHTSQLGDADIIWGIKETIKRAKIGTRDVVTSIQAFSTFTTVITLPYLSEEDIAKAIPFEAKKYVPLPLSEVKIDWTIIGAAAPRVMPPPKPGEEKIAIKAQPPVVEIFLVAVPKDEAIRYQSIIKESGLNLRALELENSALVRAVVGNDQNPVAIINIGGRSTGIIIVDKGVERINHNYEVGGFEITKAISRALNVNFKRAEELKKSMGLKEMDNNVIKQSMSSLVDLIVFETRKTMHTYEDAKKTKISKVFLVGGLANMPGFYDYFKEKLGLNVFMGNPLSRVLLPQGTEALKNEINSTFAVALGLAMRDI